MGKIRQYTGKINTYFLAVLGFIFIIDIICTWVSLTRWMPHELAIVLQFFTMVTTMIILFLAVISISVSIIYLILYAASKFKDKTKLRPVITTFFVLLAAVFSLFLERNAKEFAFTALGERSFTLIETIKSYEADNGAPPERLEPLVPGYIPKVPSTGIAAYPKYKFKALEQEQEGDEWELWVNVFLGKKFFYRPSEDYPEEDKRIGRWAYSYGSIDHYD